MSFERLNTTVLKQKITCTEWCAPKPGGKYILESVCVQMGLSISLSITHWAERRKYNIFELWDKIFNIQVLQNAISEKHISLPSLYRKSFRRLVIKTNFRILQRKVYRVRILFFLFPQPYIGYKFIYQLTNWPHGPYNQSYLNISLTNLQKLRNIIDFACNK